jgi:hypothetical protein
MSAKDDKPDKPNPVVITIDGEDYTAPGHKMTPRQLMQLGGVDPDTHYLTQAHGRDDVSYKDTPDKELTLRPGAEFHTVPTGDTTVS